MTTGYFLICDILGFSGIVGNTDETELSARIDTWVSLAKNSAETAGVTELQLLSDTLFASTPDSSDGRGRLVRFSQTLLSEGLKQSLPIRGGISFGKYSWGELTYGKAVIAAHKIEASSEWVGVACDAGLPHIADHWGVDSLVCFPAPQRSGPITLRPVVAWPVPRFAEFARRVCELGLTREGEGLEWEWNRKITNTVQFGHYLTLLRKHSHDPQHFYGLSPLETVEIELFGDYDGNANKGRQATASPPPAP